MLLLRANLDDLEVITGSAADIEPYVSAMLADSAAPPALRAIPDYGPLASIVTATTTQIIDTSGLTNNDTVNVKQISLYNHHASTSSVVTVQANDGTRQVVLWNGTLLAGEKVEYTEAGMWLHYDSNGGIYPSVGNAATQTEMEAGTATDRYVTPQGVNWHPGTNKFWVVFTGNSTTVLASWNTTSITDGTTEATITIGTDFSSANWCCLATAEGAVTTVAGARLACTRAIAAGTIIVFCVDGSATTVLADPTRWHVTGLGDQ